MSSPPAYTLEPQDLAGRCQTDPVKGLEEAEAIRRQAEYGRNELEAAEPISPLTILVRQFKDLMVLILLAATGVALLSWYLEGCHGLPSDALVIGAIIVFNAYLGFSQEYKAEKTVQELKRSTAARAQVVRGGQARAVEREELVPGDLVVLGEGDRVPADLVLLEAQRLRVNESLLTGEAQVVSKFPGAVPDGTPVDSRTCCLYAGTTVSSGTCRALVVTTGNQTELGGIATSLATTESEQTPLEIRLGRLGAQIGWGVLVLSVLVGITILALEPHWDAPTLVRVLMFSVALAVAAVPEGLPAVLTISLSAGTRRLARERAVARRMSAVETLGSVSVIVTDKTGTLTHNQMTVEQIYYDGQAHTVSGRGYAPEGEIEGRPALKGTLKWLLETGVLANSGELEVKDGRRQALGDPVDAGLLVLAEKAGLDYRALRSNSPSLLELPFTSERARTSSLRQLAEGPQLLLKGSLEAVLQRCTQYLDQGQPKPLDGAARTRFEAADRAFSERALRSLALAMRPCEGVGAEAGEEVEQELILLGLVAMGDPVREEVGPALQACRAAGVRVVMLTGDHPHTALAIARQIGLARPDEVVPTGPELAEYTDEQVHTAVREHNVFARVSPQAKLRLVQALLDQKEVVAMTGDGVNDAPALKKVHVGVAMGSGTAVAIEASDLVLLDDNFATIVTAIRYGRGVYSNVQKFIAFLFSGNFGVALAIFVGTILAGLLHVMDGSQILVPLTAAQILWMNLVTDGAPAVAFALGRPNPAVMEQPPRGLDEPVLSWDVWRYVLSTGLFVALSLLLVLDLLYPGGLVTAVPKHLAYARTAGFYTLVTARLWNSLNYRHLPGSVFSRDFFRDFYVPGACLVSWVLTVLAIYTPWLQAIFQLEALKLSTLAILTVVSAWVVLPAELFKAIIGVRMLATRNPAPSQKPAVS